MSMYDQDYYFVLEADYVENLPDLGPDKNTVYRKFEYEKQEVGTAPLFFFNVDKEDHLEDGVSIMKELPAVLFCGSDIVVSTSVRRELLKLNISNMFTHHFY